MVHARCVRIHSHSNSDRQELYRTPEELAAARDGRPAPALPQAPVETGLSSPRRRSPRSRPHNHQKYEEAADRAQGGAGPDPATIHDFVRPEPWTPEKWPEGLPDGSGDEMTLVQAINQTLKEEFRHNPDTYIWGQDVAYRTRAASSTSPRACSRSSDATRVFNAPIAEDYIIGTADGFSPPLR